MTGQLADNLGTTFIGSVFNEIYEHGELQIENAM